MNILYIPIGLCEVGAAVFMKSSGATIDNGTFTEMSVPEEVLV